MRNQVSEFRIQTGKKMKIGERRSLENEMPDGAGLDSKR
jgi:hypothetical protein